MTYCCMLYYLNFQIDPPGHGRIGGHYFRTFPSVRPFVRHKNKKQPASVPGNQLSTTYTMCENNENLLVGPGESS